MFAQSVTGIDTQSVLVVYYHANGLERMWKGTIVVDCKVFFRNMPGKTEGKNGNPQGRRC